MNRALLRRCIELYQLLGLVIDGQSQWLLMHRRNKQRLVTRVLSHVEPLLKHKDLQQLLQAAASLSKERWQLWKRLKPAMARSPLPYDFREASRKGCGTTPI